MLKIGNATTEDLKARGFNWGGCQFHECTELLSSLHEIMTNQAPEHNVGIVLDSTLYVSANQIISLIENGGEYGPHGLWIDTEFCENFTKAARETGKENCPIRDHYLQRYTIDICALERESKEFSQEELKTISQDIVSLHEVWPPCGSYVPPEELREHSYVMQNQKGEDIARI